MSNRQLENTAPKTKTASVEPLEAGQAPEVMNQTVDYSHDQLLIPESPEDQLSIEVELEGGGKTPSRKSMLNLTLQESETEDSFIRKKKMRPDKPKIAAANYGIMQRDISKLDTPTVFDNKQCVKTARSNMEDYMAIFGIEFPIPALFVKDATIYPVNPRYSIQLIKYAFPISDEYSISTHGLDGKSSMGTFKELFSNYTRGLVLRLLKREQSSLLRMGEIGLNAQEALIEFHHEGDMFGFFYKETQVLKVTKVDDIDQFVDNLKSLEDTEHDAQYFVDYNGPAHGLDISFIEKIKFDMGKKFIIGWGGTQIFIMNMETKVGEVVEINERIYHSISHCNMISSNAEGDYSYNCYVACQRNGVKQIVVFDLDEELKLRQAYRTKYHHQQLRSMMTLNYLDDLSPEFQLMISHDNQQVVFVNGTENSVLEIMDGGKFYNQRKLKHLKNKQVRFIKQDHNDRGFYFLACQEFDKFLSVEHSNRFKFAPRFQRLLEPGIIKIFDFHLNLVGDPYSYDGRSAQKKEIRVLSMRDDEFILDKVTYDEIANQKDLLSPRFLMTYEQLHCDYVNFIYSPLRAYSVQWPYVIFSGLANFVLVVNAYDRKVLKRIQVGQKDAKITINETYVTETNDLFILIQEEDMYRLYHIDLDASNRFEHDTVDFSTENTYQVNLILAYNSEVVKNVPVRQIHVRGSSAKDDMYDRNQKLQVLFLHGDDLYHWVQTHPKDTNKNQEIKWVSKCMSQLFKSRDQTVYFLHSEKQEGTKRMKTQEIKKINCLFSTYELLVIYKERGQQEKLKTINLDPQAEKIIIYSTKTDNRGASLDKKHLMKILDYVEGEVIHDCQIFDPQIIGRLKTGLYTLCNGHLYFNNNCIKMRYDVLEVKRNQGNMLSEDDIFDQYLDCFPLKPNEQIRAGTPIDAQKNHRFVYVKRDVDMNEASQITILPYLHERRVYMNRRKLATEYFWTSTITTVAQEIAYQNAYKSTQQQGGQVTDIDILELMENASLPTKKAEKKKSFVGAPNLKMGAPTLKLGTPNLMGTPKEDDAAPVVKSIGGQTQFTSIICVKSSEFKYYVYAQNGIMLNRVKWKNLADAYGHPAQTSSNGQVFILKKSKEQLADMEGEGYSTAEQAQEFATVSVVKLTVFGMQHVKTINLMDALKDLYKDDASGLAKFMKENGWFMNDNFKYLQKHMKFDIQVNNMMDIMVRITYMEDPNSIVPTDLKPPLVDQQIYYYESFEKTSVDPPQQERGFFGSSDETQLATCMLRPKDFEEKFIFNKKYLFVWNQREIEYYKLGEKFNEKTMKKLSFRISEKAIGTKIVDIRCGSNPVNIVIIVEYNPGGEGQGSEKTTDTIIWWNMDRDEEEESNEIRDPYLVLWGSAGNPYIVTDKKVYFIKQRCAITAFDYRGAIEAFKKNTSPLSVHKGHRVDGVNHNWLIFEEYLCLPFDYMTFVIKDKIECEDDCLQGNHFDPAPYNYVFNRATSFVQGAFVTQDHDQLWKVLTELEKIGIDHCEIINYTNEVVINGQNELNSALHRAVDDGNQRSINFLLETMSHIDVNASANYLSIISDLLDYENFHKFLQELPTQTIVMEEKQIFRCDVPVNDAIVRQVSTGSAFFTEDFYVWGMDESNQEGSKPVYVNALRVDWMINTDEGRKFLQDILFTGNLDFFLIDPIQYVAEFLFQRFKLVIAFILLPIFAFSHLAYLILQASNDSYAEVIFQLHQKNEGEKQEIMDHTADMDALINLQDPTVKAARTKAALVGAVCFFSWFLQFVQWIIFIYYGGFSYFKKFYSQLDTLYLFSVLTTFVFMIMLFAKDEITFGQYETLIKSMRLVAVLGFFSLYFKATYFLSLIDSVAPLIDIIIQIMVDIKWFMVVSAWYILMFAQCYDLISKSQIKFDNLSDDEIDEIPYNGLGPALWYMIQTFLGNAGTDGFYGGDQSQAQVLNIMYFVSTFLIITHFLNMLIAIMGNTFGERGEVQSQIMTRDHLRFVMDNFHLLPLAIRNKSQVKYIITAALAAGEKELTEEEKGAWISEQFDSVEKLLMDKVDKNAEYQQDTNILVAEIYRRFQQDDPEGECSHDKKS